MASREEIEEAAYRQFLALGLTDDNARYGFVEGRNHWRRQPVAKKAYERRGDAGMP